MLTLTIENTVSVNCDAARVSRQHLPRGSHPLIAGTRTRSNSKNASIHTGNEKGKHYYSYVKKSQNTLSWE